jgi:hypothetical protein
MDICGCCGQQKPDVIEVELQQGSTYDRAGSGLVSNPTTKRVCSDCKKNAEDPNSQEFNWLYGPC